jgi:hypothetical protein
MTNIRKAEVGMRPALERLDGLMLLAPRLIIMSQGYKWGVTTVWAREGGKK